jgi:steroid delta-isomerase-like uncharacterized protein
MSPHATEQNKATVRRFIREVFEQGREAAVDELLTPDFVGHTWGPSGAGTDGLKAALARLSGALADTRFVVEDEIAEGDRVAVRLTASARQVGEFMGAPASGRSYEIGEIHIFRLRDGRIAEHWHQFDRIGMLQQLGAIPAPGQRSG